MSVLFLFVLSGFSEGRTEILWILNLFIACSKDHMLLTCISICILDTEAPSLYSVMSVQ